MDSRQGVGLALAHVSRSFGGIHAVTDCTFSAPRAAVTGLIGPNGAGKSTVVDMISGLLRPDAGTISLDGMRIEKLPAYRVARAGVIRTFQACRLWDALSAYENVLASMRNASSESVSASILRRHHIGRLERARSVSALDALEAMGIAEVTDLPAGNLSGGQRRLLEFARVLVSDASVLLLDEPLSGVNPRLYGRIASAIKEFAASGVAVLLVEHHLDFIEEVCDEVIAMTEGRVLISGSMNDLRASDGLMDAYLGRS